MTESIWDTSNHKLVTQKSEGLLGGRVISWDINFFSYSGFSLIRNWIWVHLKYLLTLEVIHAFNIYGPLSPSKKKAMWEELKDILNCLLYETVSFVGDLIMLEMFKKE